MSWWTRIRNATEKVGTLGLYQPNSKHNRLTDVRDRLEKNATLGFYDPARSRREDQEVRYAAADQIKAYKEQTRIANEQIEEARNAKLAEKRRIEEKQIRSLRRNYRPAGFLDNQAGGQNVPNKLGA